MTAGGVKAHFRRLQVAFLGEILSKPSLLVKAGAFFVSVQAGQVAFRPSSAVAPSFAQIAARQGGDVSAFWRVPFPLSQESRGFWGAEA